MVRLRPDVTSGGRLGAMAGELGAMLGLDPKTARRLLLRMGRGKRDAA